MAPSLSLRIHSSMRVPNDEMAGQAGVEPATTGFGVRRSSQLGLLTPASLYNFTSLCCVCIRHEGQNFLNASFSVVVLLFLLVVELFRLHLSQANPTSSRM